MTMTRNARRAGLWVAALQWTGAMAAAQEIVPLAHFNNPPVIFGCAVTTPPAVWRCVPTSGQFFPFEKQYCGWFNDPPFTSCRWQTQGLTGGDTIKVSAECCSAPGTVGVILQVADRITAWKGLRVGNFQLGVQGRGESFPFTPELRAGPLVVNLASPFGSWLTFTTSRFLGYSDVYQVNVAELGAYSGRNVVFRWADDWGANAHIEPDWRYATGSGAPVDGTLLEETSGALWVVFDETRYRLPDRATMTRVYSNRFSYRVQDGEPARRLRGATRDGTLLREENGAIWVVYGGAKFHVPDPGTLGRLYSGWPIYQLWDGALAAMPDAPADGTLLREENGRIWVVFGGAKFHVPDPPTLYRLYGGRPILQVWDGALDGLSRIPVDGTFLREESDPWPYQMVNGHKVRPIGIDRDAVRVLWNGALAQVP